MINGLNFKLPEAVSNEGKGGGEGGGLSFGSLLTAARSALGDVAQAGSKSEAPALGPLAAMPPEALPNATLQPDQTFGSAKAAGRGIAERLRNADEPTAAFAFADEKTGKAFVYYRELNDFPGRDLGEKAQAAEENVESALAGAKARGLVSNNAVPVFKAVANGEGGIQTEDI